MPAADPTIRLGVLGLGTVGAPVATLATKRGWPTVGFDPDPIARQTLEHALPDAADLLLTAEPIDLSGCTVFVICVPTPAQAGATDLRALETACSTIAEQLQPGALVIVESTVSPGTCQTLVVDRLAASGLRPRRWG